MNPNVISNVAIVADTLVKLAFYALGAYGVQAARLFAITWLQSPTDPLAAVRRLPKEAAIDLLRKEGYTVEPPPAVPVPQV